MKSFTILFLAFFLSHMPYLLIAQSPGQVIRGTVIDAQSELPLIGVAVELLLDGSTRGAVTDAEGQFSITDVPPGRHELRFSYLGYAPRTLPNVVATTGKQVVLQVNMEESIVNMEEVVVRAGVDKGRARNEMATISARSFNLEEVTRYSGGRNDVARLAGNFAGVAVADDSRNDIIIRGNSPTGVLWRLEGVPIPNPNHFSTLGTTGGPVSALNPNLLSQSDFLTSAFPAEYGNALGGVFDVGFRNGNRDAFEATLQLSAFSGLEAIVEGPLNAKKKGSFIAAYRHSFVEVADQLGIPIGTNATPNYRDLSFKVDFGNGKAGKFSLFGIGATSAIDFLGDEVDSTDLFANPNEDAFVTSKLAIVGLRHNLIVGKDAYIRSVLSYGGARNTFQQENQLDDDDPEKTLVTDVDDRTATWSLSSYYNKKYNSRLTLRTGILAQYLELNTRVDDREKRPDLDGDGLPDWAVVRQFEGGMALLQAFGQVQYRLDPAWTLNGGLHLQHFGFNGSTALEPRLALNGQLAPRHRINFGYGLHHQTQPLPVFFFEEEVSPGEFERTNQDLDFTRSHHFVLGYEYRPAKDWRLNLETYFQHIENAAVEGEPSSFSLLNAGDDFVFPEVGSLVNAGRGRNYGVELTLEKFFTRNYYVLLTGSLFDASYRGSDGIWRNSAFNNQYVVNLLGGKEFPVGKEGRNAFTFDVKLTNAGGRYYTPVDLDASREAGTEIRLEDQAYSERYPAYFRLDMKLGFRLNSRKAKFSQQFYLDFQNLTNHENVFVRRYNELTGEVNEVYQSGFFPDLLYRVQF